MNAVSRDKFSIGYGGAAYAKGIKEVLIKKDSSAVAYGPSLENINKGLYPIARYLYFYTRVRPTGLVKDFVDFALSPAGQSIVKEVGYFPAK